MKKKTQKFILNKTVEMCLHFALTLDNYVACIVHRNDSLLLPPTTLRLKNYSNEPLKYVRSK